jgi:hypothetical protein
MQMKDLTSANICNAETDKKDCESDKYKAHLSIQLTAREAIGRNKATMEKAANWGGLAFRFDNSGRHIRHRTSYTDRNIRNPSLNQ